jgi:hypothetical protein
LACEDLVPPTILPGSNHIVLKQGIKGFLETRACFGRFALIDAHAYSIEERCNPERLQGVPCMGLAAPLITQIAH